MVLSITALFFACLPTSGLTGSFRPPIETCSYADRVLAGYPGSVLRRRRTFPLVLRGRRLGYPAGLRCGGATQVGIPNRPQREPRELDHVMRTYPYTIENGSGEELTFLGVVRDQNGERLEAKALARPGAGPPMHAHPRQEEALTVVSGKLGFQCVGEAPRYAGPGETVIFAPGIGHRWWNAGTSDLSCTGWAKPPENVEYILTALFDSMKRRGRTRPDFFDAAFLLSRYRLEMVMLEIPAVVQKVAFPVLLAVGKILGKYDRFRDAPEPISESRVGSRHSPSAV